MSIGAVRMHRGLADRAALGPQAGAVDAKERFIQTTIHTTGSLPPRYSERGTHVAGDKVSQLA
jgi:hypothetical protein